MFHVSAVMFGAINAIKPRIFKLDMGSLAHYLVNHGKVWGRHTDMQSSDIESET